MTWSVVDFVPPVDPNVGWTDGAVCAHESDAIDLMFSHRITERRTAIAMYCDVCPVSGECLARAEQLAARGHVVGVWGGRDFGISGRRG